MKNKYEYIVAKTKDKKEYIIQVGFNSIKYGNLFNNDDKELFNKHILYLKYDSKTKIDIRPGGVSSKLLYRTAGQTNWEQIVTFTSFTNIFEVEFLIRYENFIKEFSICKIEIIQEEECSICLSEFKNRSYIIPCLHNFCNECITLSKRNKNVCPLCKTKINSIEVCRFKKEK